MALTKLDEKCELIVIDLQKGIVGMSAVHPAHEIVARCAQLARAFRRHRLPVVLVNVTGSAPGRTDAQRPHSHCRPIGWNSFPSWSGSPAIT